MFPSLAIIDDIVIYLITRTDGLSSMVMNMPLSHRLLDFKICRHQRECNTNFSSNVFWRGDDFETILGHSSFVNNLSKTTPL